MIPTEEIPGMQQWVYDFTTDQLHVTGIDAKQPLYDVVEYYTKLGAMRYCSDVLKDTKPSMELLRDLEERISVARMTILVVNHRKADKKK